MPDKRQNDADASQKPKKHGHKGGIIAGVILLIIVIGIVYAYFTYGSLPLALLSAKSLSASTMINIISQRIDSVPMLNMNYSGSVIVNNTDPYLHFYFYKYYNSSRTTMIIQDLPGVGNVTQTVVTYANQSGFSCTNVWTNESQVLVVNQSNCSQNSVSYSRLENILSRFVNVSTFSNVYTGNYGIKLVNWSPCYSVSGSGSVDVNGSIIGKPGFVPSTFTFSACMSAQYDVPLYLNGTLNLGNGQYMHVNITQTGIGYITESSGIQ